MHSCLNCFNWNCLHSTPEECKRYSEEHLRSKQSKKDELLSLVSKIFADTKKVSETSPKQWYTLMDGMCHLNINYVDVRVSVEDLGKLQKLIEGGFDK